MFFFFLILLFFFFLFFCVQQHRRNERVGVLLINELNITSKGYHGSNLNHCFSKMLFTLIKKKKIFFHLLSPLEYGHLHKINRQKKNGLNNNCVMLFPFLTNNQVVTVKLVFWNFQVQWSRTLSNPTRDIVVRTVTRTEPTAKVTRFTNWNTTQVSTDT